MEQSVDEVGAGVARLGRELLRDADGLADAMTEQIRSAMPVYQWDSVVTAEELRRTCFEHVHFILGAIGRHPDLAAHESRANGRLRARAGMPLAAVMDAYRIGAGLIWDRLAETAIGRVVSAEVLVRAASDMWLVQDTFTQAMVAWRSRSIAGWRIGKLGADAGESGLDEVQHQWHESPDRVRARFAVGQSQ